MATKPLTPVSTTARSSSKKRIRKIFGDIHEVVQMPNLIEVQRESYEQFLRSNPATGYVSGLEKTLRSVFPIRDFAGTSELDFVHYELEDPKYDVTECRQRGITYAAPMKVTLRLIVFEVDAETETRSVLDIKEQDVYMGDMPLMTENGTFIVNGTERVIVSQMHRSPGVLFDHDRAVGVEARVGRKIQRFEAAREVLLCGGAVNSPQLLLLSGIGPADQLRRHGIGVRLDAPGVGRNLTDHLDICVLRHCSQPITYDKTNDLFVGLQYYLTGTGLGTSNVAEAGGFVTSKYATDGRPDLQFHFVPAMLDDHGRNRLPGHGFPVPDRIDSRFP